MLDFTQTNSGAPLSSARFAAPDQLQDLLRRGTPLHGTPNGPTRCPITATVSSIPELRVIPTTALRERPHSI